MKIGDAVCDSSFFRQPAIPGYVIASGALAGGISAAWADALLDIAP